MGKERTSLEVKSGFEKRKHKKKAKEKANEDELERNFSVPEVGGDKLRKEVEQPNYDKSGGNHMDSGERANKKKKRKRGQEGDEISIGNMKELLIDEEKVGKTMEKVDSTGRIKKRKKILEDDKIDMTTEYGNVAKITSKGGKKEKKEKKKKRENMGCDLEQDIINDGMEAGVASKHLEKKEKKKKRKNMEQDIINDGMEAGVASQHLEKKEKKKKRKNMGCELEQNIINDGMEAGVASQHSEGLIIEKSDLMLEERRKEKRTRRKNSGTELQESVADDTGTIRNRKSDAGTVENGKKRKKSKPQTHGIMEDCNEDKKKARSSNGSLRAKNGNGTPDRSEDSAPRKALKRVSFVDDVEVFSTSDGSSDEHEQLLDDVEVFSTSDGSSDVHEKLVRGKRFSKEEDKIVKEAVLRYIEEHALGDDGLNMVLRSKSHPDYKDHPELKTCWKDIGAALPWRPFKSVYYRAHILFERADKRKWTSEEYEEVKKFHEDKGADWRTLGDKLGKHRIHVKDAWRRIKLPNQKKGHWSQEEYETLFDLVNMDLRMKVYEEKKTKHGMLRDNICWEAISETLGTRTNAVCSMKWYKQLTSPLVSQKLWADIDDYRLLDALNNLDACCIEDVDWDDLLEHRPGDVCQKRWYQMVKHIGQHALKSFPEQVEVLSQRYLADLIEAREIYANKPAVD